MATVIRRSVGAGRDFATLAEVGNYIQNLDLVALDQMLIFEVPADLVVSGTGLEVKVSDAARYVLITPSADAIPAGSSGTSPNQALGWSDPGVLLTFKDVYLGRGIAIRGFKITSTLATGYTVMATQQTGAGRPAEISNNRIYHQNNDLPLIRFGSNSKFFNNIVYAASTVPLFEHTWEDDLYLNTFIKLPAATTNIAGRMGSYGAGSCTDSIFYGFGNEPLAASSNGLAPGTRARNYTDSAAPTGVSVGMTKVASNLLIRGVNDARPADGSPVLGVAQFGKFSTDIRGTFRGEVSDVGAVQLVAAALPPKPTVTITNQVLDQANRRITVSGTTTGNPDSATVALTPVGGAALPSRVVTLTSGAFSVTWSGLTPGDYEKPVVIASNYSGASDPSSGGNIFTIQAPPLPVGTLTYEFAYGASVSLAGTVTNSPTAGELYLRPHATNAAGATLVGPIAVTINGTNWSVEKDDIPAGNYLAPEIKFSNAAGPGNAVPQTQAFTVAVPSIPTVTITEQVRVGLRVYLSGTFTNFPLSGKVSIAPADVANGAIGKSNIDVLLDKVNKTFTAVILDLSPGDYKKPVLTLTNKVGTSPAATNALVVTIVNQDPPIIPGVTVKTIGGGGGKDFATLALFGDWLKTRDLVSNGEIVHGYVYDDIVKPVAAITAGQTNDIFYCKLSPAPGLSVSEIEAELGVMGLGYGKYGVELTLTSASDFMIGAGIHLTGFRIKVPKGPLGQYGTAGIFVSKSNSVNTDEKAYIKRNRFWLENDNSYAINTGNAAVIGCIEDNLFIHASGNGGSIFNGVLAQVKRNTFIRQGTSIGYKTYDSSTWPVGQLIDNVFWNCGGVPVAWNAGAQAISVNNLTNATLTAPIIGFTVNTVDQFFASVTNFIPKANGPLIGTASDSAKSINDVRGNNRGPVPDLGAAQLELIIPLPVATITKFEIDGQDITIEGTVTNEPHTGTAVIMVGTIPNGAVQQGPTLVVIEGSDWSITWTELPGGNYKTPDVRFENLGGISAPAAGGRSFTIQSFTGLPQIPAAEPSISISTKRFVNKTITLTGVAQLQGGEDPVLNVFFDPVNGTPSTTPIAAVIDADGNWTVAKADMSGKFIARLVLELSDGRVVSLSSSQLASSIVAGGNISLPRAKTQ